MDKERIIFLAKNFFGYPIDEIINYPNKVEIVKCMIREMDENQYVVGKNIFFLCSRVRRNIEIILNILEIDLIIKEEEFDDDDCFVVYLNGNEYLNLVNTV